MIPWPICPLPREDESLISWFTRVGRQYGMSPSKLLAAVERRRVQPDIHHVEATLRRFDVINSVADLGQLPVWARVRLWRRPTHWELPEPPLGGVCPQCWVEDIDQQIEPYGRQRWQQAWYTICHVHREPLMRSSLVEQAMLRAASSSRQQRVALRAVVCRLGHSRVCGRFGREVIGALLGIQRAAEKALIAVAPDQTVWGPLLASEFLRVLADVTAWSLTHFESAKAWCAAEDLTDLERHSPAALLGRHLRGRSEHPNAPCTRDLKQITDPAVRRSALWLARALMSSRHVDAADRVGGCRPQVRQRNRLAGAAPTGLQWLADRSEGWPAGYRLARWINFRSNLTLNG